MKLFSLNTFNKKYTFTFNNRSNISRGWRAVNCVTTLQTKPVFSSRRQWPMVELHFSTLHLVCYVSQFSPRGTVFQIDNKKLIVAPIESRNPRKIDKIICERVSCEVHWCLRAVWNTEERYTAMIFTRLTITVKCRYSECCLANHRKQVVLSCSKSYL